MKRIFSVLVMAFICLASVCGQSKLSNSSALFLAQHKQLTPAEMKMTPMGKMVKMQNGRQMIDCYVHFKDAIDENVLAMYNAELHVKFDELNIATAAVPVDALEALSQNENVALVEVAQSADLQLDWARKISMVDPVINGDAPFSQSYLGRGVLLGVVDNELQYAHPAFWNAEHTKYRIKKVWNQTKSGGRLPDGFSYGSEFIDSVEIINAKYDITNKDAESGHATHVMGIAAGADHTLNYYGIAQEADIVFVSCPGTSMTNIPEGIRYIFQQATDMNKPCVVNVSMGGTLGPHDGTSTESRLIDAMIGPGRLVCGSAGNAGVSRIHWSKMYNPEEDDTLGGTMYAPLDVDGFLYNYCPIDIWGDVNQSYDARIVVFHKGNHEYLYQSPWYNATPVTQQTYNINVRQSISSTDDFVVSGTVAASKNDNNQRGNISATINITSLPSRCSMGVEIRSRESGVVNIYTTETYGSFTGNNQKEYGFTDGDNQITVCEPSGVSQKIISVGAYTSYRRYFGTFGAKADFSSVGPTADGRIKPDIAAPGQTLMSAFPDYDALKDERNAETTVDGKTYYYSYMQGTSMSSPYAAGVVATWLEANPNLDYEGIIDVFQHSSTVDSFTGEVPNNSWGYGKIDAYHGLIYILGLNVGVQNPELPSVLAVYEENNSDIFKIGFAKSMNDLTISVSDMSGRIVYTNAEGDVMAGQEISVDLSNMAPGIYMINVGGENYKVIR